MGNKRDPVWEHFNATEIPFDSHLAAQCKLCFKTWKRGKPSELKAHLALKCPMVNRDIKIKYLQLIKSEEFSNKKRRNNGDSLNIHSYFESDKIDPQKKLRANQAMVHFFVCCGIPFSIADSPFFHDFTKSLCSGYEPPKRTTLSNNLLDSEIANITLKIEKEIRDSKNLTLGN